MTQYKGDSETHPLLSPSDEFADFERYKHLLDGGPLEHVEGSYVRAGLIRGMQLEAEIGVNPYKFGMIGATDTHTGLASAEEGNFLGKYAQDSIPENKAKETVPGSFGWDASAMGFAGVWATENSLAAGSSGNGIRERKISRRAAMKRAYRWAAILPMLLKAKHQVS